MASLGYLATPCLRLKAKPTEKENYKGKAILKQVVAMRREDGLGQEEGWVPMG